MDPRKIVSRNRNWWNVKSSRHEYELVGASEVLDRSRFEDDRPLVGFLFCFSFLPIDTHKYNNTDTKDQSIHQKTYDTMRDSRNHRVDRCVFYSDLFLDKNREAQSDRFIESNCTVLESNGPYPYGSNDYL